MHSMLTVANVNMATSRKLAVVCLLKLLGDDGGNDDENLITIYNDEMDQDEQLLLSVASAAVIPPSDRSEGCVPNFFEEVVPVYSFSTFKSHFRMSPSTFEVCMIKYSKCVVSFAIRHRINDILGMCRCY